MTARRIDSVPSDAQRAAAFLRQADERLAELERLSSAVVKYGVAYDAAHDVGEALLAAYGYRTTTGPGQHEALGRFLRAVLDFPPAERAAGEFDRLRRARNQDRYEAKTVGAADAAKAERVARELYSAAVGRGALQP
ncbi:HEPN domain-containing protein [Glaciihabitans sp. UYNi722]|uniref:HEPN domain-containing protein n=1 Tax=Glaciihabitans sp. UYNi722 TaxID=3156344 RepID=UPI003396A2E3